jgi:esterase/lipase superfamily enzyme
VKEEHFKWYSPILGRDTEMLVFGHAGQPIIIFPTSMGTYHQNKDFHLIDSVAGFVEQGLVKIYCPDSVDEHSFYNEMVHPAMRIRNHTVYDDFILNEIVAKACAETGQHKVTVAGCSFGGYQAVNFAMRHPDRVSNVFSMGGAFDITNHLDGYYDDNVYYNNPVDYVGSLNDSNIWRMGIVLGVGEHDFCLPQNKRLSEILQLKNVPHWLDIRPGAVHDWPVWREMLPDYLAQMKNN